MNTTPPIKITVAENPNYTPPREVIFQVDFPTVTIGPGQTLDIEMDCVGGFSVFIPFPGFFHSNNGSDQIFPATQLKAGEPEGIQPWSVSLTRTDDDNTNDKKDFCYGIYLKGADTFAVGNSPPRMNLKP
jgi:hypothetical protein